MKETLLLRRLGQPGRSGTSVPAKTQLPPASEGREGGVCGLLFLVQKS